MAKKIDAYIKLQVPAGQANPSPPVGPALGQHGVNIMEFCKAFNAQTQSTGARYADSYCDHVFTVIVVLPFITKTPPASILLKKSGKSAERFRYSQYEESWQGNPGATGRDCDY